MIFLKSIFLILVISLLEHMIILMKNYLKMKMNVPQEEAEQCVKKVRERQMGYWFENMEKMDIQQELGLTKAAAMQKIMEKCKLSKDVAEEKIELYWKE